VGLSADEVQSVLTTDAYTAEVRSDEEEARELGITTVPYFVFDERLAVSGAQPAEVLLSALTRTWHERAAKPAPFEEGSAYEPEGY